MKMDNEQSPVARAIAVNAVHVYVMCPFCGKVHVHGSGGDFTKEDYGYRVPHCRVTEEYRIVSNADTIRKSGLFTGSELRSQI
jgi:hypothetical protein